LLKEWRENEILRQDNKECIYLYRQDFIDQDKSYIRTAFIALLELEELGTNVLPHEKTLSNPLADRIDLMNHTSFNTGQVFVMYDDREKIIDSLLEGVKYKPEFAFEEKGVKHKLWRITDKIAIGKITEEMKNYRVIIADGHHRYKTSLEFRKLHPDNEKAGYRMVTFVNSFDEGMIIFPTNRLLFNIAIDFQDLLIRLGGYFEIEEVGDRQELVRKVNSVEIMIDKEKNLKNHVLGLIDNYNKKNYLLTLRNTDVMRDLLPKSTDIYQKLDVNILHKLIFEMLLGITEEEQASGNKIESVKGNRETLKKLGDEKYKAAFIINPPLMREVFLTARANETMPQKSTYFYPKIFSGLVSYNMEE
jgi:uncharacterized protein (DUF1015 family)